VRRAPQSVSSRGMRRRHMWLAAAGGRVEAADDDATTVEYAAYSKYSIVLYYI
jgi:hypothetical protein